MRQINGVKQIARGLKSLLHKESRTATGTPAPKVSIIMPFYNVQSYLSEAINSVINQTNASWELLLVDDGSTDGSTKVANKAAAEDRRIRVFAQSHAGTGAARNLGVRNAVGEYLSFLDSDDVLPSNALHALQKGIEGGSADVAVGALRRFDSSRSWTPEWVAAVHTGQKDTKLSDFPVLLRNNYPCGKLFRRTFWDAQGLEFRTGVIYEDQPLVAQLMLRAKRIKVLADIVYNYRAREDRSSVSQRPEDIADLRDRVLAWRETARVLGDEADAGVLSAWYDTLYQTHFQWYLMSASIGDDVYWHTLREALVDLKRHEPSGVKTAIPVEKRVAMALLETNQRDALVAFRDEGGFEAEHFPAALEGSILRHRLPVPPQALALLRDDILDTPVSDLHLKQQLLRGGWVERGGGKVLRLVGFARIPFRYSDDAPPDVAVSLVDTESGKQTEFDMVQTNSNSLGLPEEMDGQGWYIAELDRESIPVTVGQAQLRVRVCIGDSSIAEPMRNLSHRGGLAEASAAKLGGDLRARLVAGKNRHVPLRLVVERPAFVADRVEVDGRTLRVQFHSPVGELAVGARINSQKPAAEQQSGISLKEADSGEFELDVPGLTRKSKGRQQTDWVIRIVTKTGSAVPLSWPEGRVPIVPVGDGVLRATCSAAGNLKLEEFPNGVLFLTGLIPIPGGVELVAEVATSSSARTIHVLRRLPLSDALDSPGKSVGISGQTDGSGVAFESKSGILHGIVRRGGHRDGVAPVVATQSVLASLPIFFRPSAVSVERSWGRTTVFSVPNN